MSIYLLLLIPVLNVLVLYFFFKHKILWWEFLIPVVGSVIFIFAAKYIAIESLVSDTQYLGGYVKEVRYYEDWNEYIHKMCTRCSGTGKTRTCVPYDCSYVSYHPEYWTAETTLGTYNINKSKYSELLSHRFKTNPIFKDMQRHYHTDDGDMYYGLWDGKDGTLEPVVAENRYENRPKASQSVYRFQALDSIDIKTYHPFEYPPLTSPYYQTAILGFDDPIAERKLQILNSRLGGSKHVKVFILVFRNQPIEAGHIQERYWEGSNKNEFVVTIGLDNENNVQWVYDFSWTEVAETKVETREFILAQKKIDLSSAIDFINVEIQDKWIPRNFHEFDVLTIQPSITAIIIIFIFTIGLNAGISWWVINNDFDEENPTGDSYYRGKGYGYSSKRW